MNRFFIFLFIIIITFVNIGCASTGSRRSDDASTPRLLEVATLLKFQDVPVPTGFKIIPDESFIFDNDITRLGLLKYSGRANGSTIVRFYRDQMPLYNWRFVNLIEFGTRIINFDRDDQTCTIIINTGHLSSTVVVSVAPKAGKASTYRAQN